MTLHSLEVVAYIEKIQLQCSCFWTREFDSVVGFEELMIEAGNHLGEVVREQKFQAALELAAQFNVTEEELEEIREVWPNDERDL